MVFAWVLSTCYISVIQSAFSWNFCHKFCSWFYFSPTWCFWCSWNGFYSAAQPLNRFTRPVALRQFWICSSTWCCSNRTSHCPVATSLCSKAKAKFKRYSSRLHWFAFHGCFWVNHCIWCAREKPTIRWVRFNTVKNDHFYYIFSIQMRLLFMLKMFVSIKREKQTEPFNKTLNYRSHKLLLQMNKPMPLLAMVIMRKKKLSVKYSSINRFIPLNMFWVPSHTPLPIYVCGPCLLLMLVSWTSILPLFGVYFTKQRIFGRFGFKT